MHQNKERVATFLCVVVRILAAFGFFEFVCCFVCVTSLAPQMTALW
jgi:hypothetical protein